MSFLLTGLPMAPFEPYFKMDEAALKARGVDVAVADDSEPGFPCRVSLAHAAPGTRLLLINYEHQSGEGPYRSRHAVYVAEGAAEAALTVGEVPDMIAVRPLSVRAFDSAHRMIDADLVDGHAAAGLIERFFENSETAYQHIHFAKRGCFAARAVRA